MKKIGDVIRKYRISNNFTQFKFAEKIGISSKYLSDLETNRRAPSIALIKRIADVLKIDEKILIEIKEISELEKIKNIDVYYPDEKLKRLIKEIKAKEEELNQIQQNIKIKKFEYEKLERTSGARSKITWLCIDAQKNLSEKMSEILSIYSLADETVRLQSTPAIKQLILHLDVMSNSLKRMLKEVNTLEVK